MYQTFGDPDEVSREEILENVVTALSNGALYSPEDAYDDYGKWLYEELENDERVRYSDFHNVFVIRESEL